MGCEEKVAPGEMIRLADEAARTGESFSFLCGFPDHRRREQARLGIHPQRQLTSKQPWDNQSDPFQALARFIEGTTNNRSNKPTMLCLGYDLKNAVESLPAPKSSPYQVPDLYAIQYEDNLSLTEETPHVLQQKILESLKQLPQKQAFRIGELEASVTRQQYVSSVKRALDYIVAGDIYQVNIAQRFSFAFAGCSWDLFKRLYLRNPALFSVFLRAEDFDLIVCSPERLLKRTGQTLESRPIKGTRPRGKTPLEDKSMLRELLLSGKEKAELIMITDLHRNDLGKVSEYGMVEVVSKRHVHRMTNVFHTESIIRSTLREGIALPEILKAMVPGGSVTGCPKVRAMEIIDDLEPCSRQFYTGAVGYLDCPTDFDLAMTIRCITFHRASGTAWFDIGSGIVAESDPESEYNETLDKARSIMEVFGVSL